jgi:hypothetical protein
MAIVNLEGTVPVGGADTGRANESSVSAVSWAAILAGAVVAVSVTFILTSLGSALGLSSISPWAHKGVSATGFTIFAAVWIIVVQWGSSAVGGYTAGRLRTKWAGLHTHEVFFRDTAHGLVTWATATVFGALLIGAAGMHAAGAGAQAAAKISGPTMERAAHGRPGDANSSYEVDKLFRSTSGEAVSPERYAEASRLLGSAAASGRLSTDDSDYLSAQVAARSGISRAEAKQRVDDTVAQMKESADAARAAAAKTSLYLALSMFIGAFIASASAALGGKRRDLHL